MSFYFDRKTDRRSTITVRSTLHNVGGNRTLFPLALIALLCHFANLSSAVYGQQAGAIPSRFEGRYYVKLSFVDADGNDRSEFRVFEYDRIVDGNDESAKEVHRNIKEFADKIVAKGGSNIVVGWEPEGGREVTVPLSTIANVSLPAGKQNGPTDVISGKDVVAPPAISGYDGPSGTGSAQTPPNPTRSPQDLRMPTLPPFRMPFPSKASGSTRVHRFKIRVPSNTRTPRNHRIRAYPPQPANSNVLPNRNPINPRGRSDSTLPVMPRPGGSPSNSPFQQPSSQLRPLQPVIASDGRPTKTARIVGMFEGAPSPSPKGVSMRIGINRGTYQRAEAPASLLSTIRDRK